MKIISEDGLRDFNFWCGAKDNANKLTPEELDAVESFLEEAYPDGMTDTGVNDLFWFDFEAVLEWIGKEECPDCGEIHPTGEPCECEEEEEQEDDEEEDEE